jgi:hypothetical protein
MTTEHLTAGVGNGHMQVRAIRRYRASQGQYFEVAAKLGRSLGAGESQLGDAEAPDALDNERGARLALMKHVFDSAA